MLDFDPELSVAVEGKEILVTLPGANYAVTYLLPALNHLRASTSCMSSAALAEPGALHLGIRPRLIRPASRERPRPRMLMMGAK